MLDIGFGELLILAVAALFIFGPDKLPKLAADAARTFRTVRQMIASARRDLTDQLGPEFEGLNLDDLNPRTFVRKQLLDDLDAELDDRALADDAGAGRRSDGRSSAQVTGSGRRSRVPPPASSKTDRPADARRANGARGAAGDRQTPRRAAPLRRGERPPYDADAT